MYIYRLQNTECTVESNNYVCNKLGFRKRWLAVEDKILVKILSKNFQYYNLKTF